MRDFALQKPTIQNMIQELNAPLDFSNYKFRCSSWGNIMGEGVGVNNKKAYEKCVSNINETNKEISDTPEEKKKLKTYQNLCTKLSTLELERKELEKVKDAPPKLSQTAISYLLEIYCCVRDGIKKDINSKYFEKGLAVEEAAIELISDVDNEFYVKNTERLENEFISGECDIFHDNRIIIDNKSCWDRFTFQRKTIEKVNEIYKWQGIGYMGLWGAEEFVIVNTLMNMPENLIADELKRMLYQYGKNMEDSEVYQNAITEFKKKCYFDNLPLAERVYKFPPIKFSAELYSYGIEMVKIARNWLNEYAKKEFNRINGIVEIVEEPEAEVVLEVVADSRTKKWYYWEENKTFQCLFDEDFNSYTKELQEKLFFVCNAVTFQQEEAEVELKRLIAEAEGVESTDSGRDTPSNNPDMFIKRLEESVTIPLVEAPIPASESVIEAEIVCDFSDTCQCTECQTRNAEQAAEVENQEMDIDILMSTIEGCMDVDMLKKLFVQVDSQYELSEEIRNEFANREKELQSQVSEEQKLVLRISECKSADEAITLYKEIKDKFVTYPHLKEKLTQKKNSFNVSEPEVIVDDKPKRTSPTLVEGEYSEEELAKIRGEVDLCKNAEEIRTIVRNYFKTEAQLNIPSHKATRTYINNIGVAMSKKEKSLSK